MSNIDVRLVPSKIAFFFFFASVGCVVPFVPVFLVSTGLTVRETGLIMGLSYVAGTLFPLIFGWIADSTRYRRILFTLIFLGYAIAFFSMPFVADVAKSGSAKVTFHRNSSMRNKTNSSSNYLLNHNVKMSPDSEFSSKLFCALLIITVLARGFQNSFMGIIDSIVSNVIQHSGTNENYGQQAMFSALGLALGSMTSSAISDRFPQMAFSSYMGNFYTFLPCLFPMIPVINLMYLRTSWSIEAERSKPVKVNELLNEASEMTQNKESNPSDPVIVDMKKISPTNSESKTHQLIHVLKKPDNLIVLATLIICGLLRTVSVSFIYPFMINEMGASKTVIGIAEGTLSLSQFITLLFSKVLMKTFRGPKICMWVVVAAYCTTLLAVSFVRNPWFVILFQVIRGAGIGLLRSSMVQHTADVSPKEIYNTMFLLNICFFIGVPGVVGNFAGGLLYHQFKGAALFQGACVLGCGWLLFIGLFTAVRRKMIGSISDTVPVTEDQGLINS